MDLRQQPCLVVGGGEVAARKADLLLRAGAQVRVVAKTLSPAMLERAHQPHLQCEVRPYVEADLDAVVLVIAATNDRAVNARVSQAARARRLPVNVVDDPQHCSFIVPALVDRSPVIVAVGTAGSVPVLARLLRGRIEAMLPQRYADLAQLCARARAQVQQLLPDVTRRRRFWEAVLDGEPAELALAGRLDAAERALHAVLHLETQGEVARPAQGEAYLIGAGPNDPELMSFRALRCLQRAELVLFARQVSVVIVDLSRRDAERRSFTEPLSAADAVLQQLVAATGAGQRVCVLAPGDAFREPDGEAFAARAAALGVACHCVPAIA